MGNAISSVGSAVGQIGQQVANAASPQVPGQLTYSAGTTPLNANFANNANQIKTNIQDPNLVNQQVTDALYKQQTQFLDPQFERSQSALANQLANQGITQGSEAYNNAMQMANAQKQQAYESARNSAIGAGVNAASTLFGNQLAGANFGNQALGQQFGQGLAAQQAGNTAQNQTFAQNLANANLGNTAVIEQNKLDVQRQNAANMIDAMNKQGLYGLGGALLGSPSGLKTAGSALGSLGSGLGSLISGAGSLGSSLGGLFGGSSSAALPDWAAGITDAETLNALGLGSSGGLGGLFSGGTAGFDPTGGWLTAALAADKLTGGGLGKTAGDLVSGAGDVVGGALGGVGDVIGSVFDW